MPVHSAQGPVVIAQVKQAIGVGTQYFVSDALARAKQADARLVVIQLDTPGGLVSATREIIAGILASPVPVAVFVAPRGARAASAGTFLAYAAHIAAMAPGTHLGAATPVPMSVPGLPQQPKPKDGKSEGAGAAQRKIMNDSIAYLRTLAQLRGRSEAWAEKFVRDAATLTASEALKEKVVDVVAMDVSTLLTKLEGRRVKVNDNEIALQIAGAPTEIVKPDWKVRFLTTITDPNIAFILLLIGIYGILFEFWSPGLTGPGVVGAISLIVALMALSALPLNYAGLALLILGMLLMIGEAIAPGFGILGIGGTIAFVVGAIFLFDPSGADIDIQVYWPVIIAAAATSALVLVGILGLVISSRRKRIVTGSEELIGLDAKVVSWEGGQGKVHVHGEIWSARADGELQPGAKVKIARRDGLTLIVAP